MSDAPESIWTTGTESTGSWDVEPSITKWKIPLGQLSFGPAPEYREFTRWRHLPDPPKESE
jgi:hypothetical protein